VGQGETPAGTAVYGANECASVVYGANECASVVYGANECASVQPEPCAEAFAGQVHQWAVLGATARALEEVAGGPKQRP
jgi:hypothetical protein